MCVVVNKKGRKSLRQRENGSEKETHGKIERGRERERGRIKERRFKID